MVPDIRVRGVNPALAPGDGEVGTRIPEALGLTVPEQVDKQVSVRGAGLPVADRSTAALPSPASFHRDEAEAATPPRSPVEERVASIVAPLLGLERVGVAQSFLLLGGHSLLGIQLIARLREAYGVEVSLECLFDNPTVAAVSFEIERLLVERLEAMSEEEVERILDAGPAANWTVTEGARNGG